MIQDNLQKIKSNIHSAISESPYDNQQVTLVTVTKNHEIDELKELYQAGSRIFGENRVQEFLTKKDQLPKDIHWHLIGHLQKNKVKYIIGEVELIHSVDSISLLDEIQRLSAKQDTVTNILIQVNVAHEESKFGIDESEVETMIQHCTKCSNISLKGFMCMAPISDDEAFLTSIFKKMRIIFDKYSNMSAEYDNINIEVLSMGMTSDYQTAIRCGANMVRIGTAVFQQNLL